MGANISMDIQQLNKHREVLLRYAMLQVGNDAVAQDAVQETLLAALQTEGGFRNQSSLRTWLIGILKHKIADHYRSAEKQHSLQDYTNSEDEESPEVIEKLLFDNKGHWIGRLPEWSEPEHALEQTEFWQVYEWCQNNLPAPHARAFMLRELVGFETGEICDDMNISHSACRVYLHRARLGLRECLEQRWFKGAA